LRAYQVLYTRSDSPADLERARPWVYLGILLNWLTAAGWAVLIALFVRFLGDYGCFVGDMPCAELPSAQATPLGLVAIHIVLWTALAALVVHGLARLYLRRSAE